eukprot:CAMPEP_0172534644 /NCGR_PEP_ID=MMETSP1067-20121228/6932_1 /TAXON_ID=265564 ORGANISM="Thalassiosira punctigera, Strain Tpunct2005C2" /NCGR_SAMPLE_ID=MMETSP1067 /ASSEMBLY_ACC=CAM_ASM_000444 /LENGTH=254 /DNA_ID=CAMNT_0013319459 /DNA_START=206 /DNA_END=970 /DNA_ORIENTATION=-
MKRRLPRGRNSELDTDNADTADFDAESQLKDKESLSIRRSLRASGASVGSERASSAGATMRDVCVAVNQALKDKGEGDSIHPIGVGAILQDYITSIVLGVITVSVLVLLDHHNIIHFQHTHNFRAAAFQLLNDPETIANIEESSRLKLMPLADYESKRSELDGVSKKIASLDEIFQVRRAEAEETKKEVDAIRPEYDTLMANKLLELNKYCGGCSWGGKTTCDARVQFLQDNYNTRLIPAKISAMGKPSCKNDA